MELELEINHEAGLTWVSPVKSIRFINEYGKWIVLEDCLKFEDYFDCEITKDRGLCTVVFNTPVNLEIGNGLHAYQYNGVTSLIEGIVR